MMKRAVNLKSEVGCETVFYWQKSILLYMKAEEKAAAERTARALDNVFHFMKWNFRQTAFLPVLRLVYYAVLLSCLACFINIATFGFYPVNKASARSAPPPLPSAVPNPAEYYGPPLPIKRNFINSGILRPKIKPPKKQEPDFPLFSTSVFVPKFFDSHERFARVDLSSNARLRFVTAVDFFPFNYIDKNGNLAGYNIDLVRALCAELRVENICRIEAVPWSALNTRLQTGAADALIAGLAPTSENRVYLNFSRAYMRFPARFITLRGGAVQKDSQNFMRLSYDFSEFLLRRGASLRVGVIHNTAHEKMLENYFAARLSTQSGEKGKNTLHLITFTDREKLIEGLKAKKIDLAFGDGMNFALALNAQKSAKTVAEVKITVAKVETETAAPVKAALPLQADEEACCIFIGGSYMGIGYLGQGMRIAVAKKDKKLIAALNYALQQLERKGKLAELYLRYFPVGFY